MSWAFSVCKEANSFRELEDLHERGGDVIGVMENELAFIEKVQGVSGSPEQLCRSLSKVYGEAMGKKAPL